MTDDLRLCVTDPDSGGGSFLLLGALEDGGTAAVRIGAAPPRPPTADGVMEGAGIVHVAPTLAGLRPEGAGRGDHHRQAPGASAGALG